jgi:hypothetical protein
MAKKKIIKKVTSPKKTSAKASKKAVKKVSKKASVKKVKTVAKKSISKKLASNTKKVAVKKKVTKKAVKKAIKKVLAKNVAPKKTLLKTTKKVVKKTVSVNTKATKEKKPTSTKTQTKPEQFTIIIPEKRINQVSYDMLRQDIITALWKNDEITFDELIEAMVNIHGRNFIADSHNEIKDVLVDLISIDLIEKVNREGNRVVHRIRQRLTEE